MKSRIFVIALFTALAPVSFAQVTARPLSTPAVRSTSTPTVRAVSTPPAVSAPALVTSDASSVSTRPKVDDSIAETIDTFFALLAKNQIDKAYERLTFGTKIAEQAKEVATLRSRTQQAIVLFGDVRGHELVQVKNVGTHLLAATYLSLGKDFPLRWRFYFYRSDGPWKLIDIRVDDRLVDMFDERPASEAPGTGGGTVPGKP